MRRLNTALNDSTMHRVSEDDWRIVRQYWQEAVIEQQAFRRLQVIRDSAQHTLNVSEG